MMQRGKRLVSIAIKKQSTVNLRDEKSPYDQDVFPTTAGNLPCLAETQESSPSTNPISLEDESVPHVQVDLPATEILAQDLTLSADLTILENESLSDAQGVLPTASKNLPLLSAAQDLSLTNMNPISNLNNERLPDAENVMSAIIFANPASAAGPANPTSNATATALTSVAKIQDKNLRTNSISKGNIPLHKRITSIGSTGSATVEKMNFEGSNFSSNKLEYQNQGTSYNRPSRTKKEKGLEKIKNILEASGDSTYERLFSSDSDEYKPDSSSCDEYDVTPRICNKKKTLKKRNLKQTKYLNNLGPEINGNIDSGSSEKGSVSQNEEHLLQEKTPDTGEPPADVENNRGETVPLIHSERKRRKGEEIDSKDWARNLNAAKRRRGDKYLGLIKQDNGKYELAVEKEERKLKERCNCKNVRQFDCSKVVETDRQKLFNNFWKGIESWEAKRATVIALVDKSKPDFRRGNTDIENSRKTTSFKYHLKVGDARVRVCKKMFLNTLCLGEKSVRSWVLKSALDKQILQEDENDVDDPQFPEGFNLQKKSSKDTHKRNEIKQFLESLPKMESHYCRSNSTKIYLEPIWESKSQLYREYERNCQEKNVQPGSRALFHTVFQNMNIGFFLPKKDQCETCIKYGLGKVSEEDYQEHQKRKVDAREEKENDKKRAQNSNDISVYAVDVQKVLTCPDIKASTAYYKTKLKVHNWSVYNLGTHEGTCYVWHEGIGGLDSDVFASMLVRFLTKELEKKPGVSEFIIWSDGCTYQNRCETVANALLYFAIKHKVTVYQKYLEVGHTQMKVDSMHSVIEKKLAKQEHYVPADFVRDMRAARVTPNPYTVESLNYRDFFDYSNGYYKSIRPGSKKGDPYVTDLRCLKFTADGHIYYKLNLKEEWSELPRRPKPVAEVFNELQPLYVQPLPIQERKFKDLQELKTCLEDDYHHFYDNLRHN